MKTSSKAALIIGAAEILLVAAPSLARAQDNKTSELSEIVVTAQKRSQRALSIPISITAIAGETLEKQHITESSQLAQMTPGLTWGEEGGNEKPYVFLRGVGNNDYRSGANSPVATYLDGAYQGNSFGPNQLLMDLNRIEVLRGPQGTLWGKNTTGGLINYVPNVATVGAPLEGDIDAGVGNFGSWNLSGAVGGPIGDKLAFRIAGSTNASDGYFTSDNPATSGRYGREKWYGARLSVAYEPTDDLSVVVELNYSKSNTTPAIAKSLGLFDPAAGAFSFTPCASPTAGQLGTVCGDVYGYVSASDPYAVAPNYPAFLHSRTVSPVLKIDDKIGDYTLSSITSFTDSKRRFYFSADNTPSALYEESLNDTYNSLSQELRLASPETEKLSWIVGAYAFADKLSNYNAGSVPAVGVRQGSLLHSKSQNLSAFADATYHFTPKLELTAGVRYTHDERTAGLLIYNTTFIAGRFNSQQETLTRLTGVVTNYDYTKRSTDNVSGRVVLSYQFAPNNMLYASVSNGFKGGDVNTADFGRDALITGPEHLTAYELGVKGVLIDHILTYDAAIYHYDFRDMQVYTQIGYSVLLSNAGRARMRGFDGSLHFRPTDRLSGDLGLAYLDSKYVKYSDPTFGDFSGNTTPYAPKAQINAKVSYDIPLGEDRLLTLSADGSYRSKIYFSSSNATLLSQGGYAVYGANVRYALNDKVAVSAYVKNLSNKFYWTSGYDFSFAGANFMFPSEPRSYGLQIKYKY